ncbi:MAG TPA: thioredoxin domain-containing protein, partial [Rhodobacteraceae bacterium]|nr:thioredoxin domain-containing protein [Paracoccaceae bacterium]
MRILIGFLLALLAGQSIAQNRLARESSLYLQQHADNPVDWYPWGPEALEKAQTEGKMIFVSVGYAACHWCHVMEAESFENEEIAAFLNEHFVSIKIDRERRPDLDEQFVIVTTALTGSSGWPNSVFMTPEAEPFFAGGYFPPDAFLQALKTIVEVWETDNTALRSEAFNISQRLRDYLDQTAVLG